MKRFIRFLLVLCMAFSAGCMHAEGTYQEQLNQRIERAITDATAGPTFSHGIYSFYKEPSIGRLSSAETSSVFMQDGVKFVMNLNVSSIVNSKYYDSKNNTAIPEGLDVLARSGGTFADFMGDEHSFEVTLMRLNEDVFTYAKTDLLEFYAISGELQALQVAETMMRIARTVKVDREAVVATYSARQEIDYERKRLELFQNVVPENGVIDELFEGNNNYAGVADNYVGDNYDENMNSEPSVDASMGDADDMIGEPFGDTIDSPDAAPQKTSEPEGQTG